MLRFPERDWLVTSDPEDVRAVLAAGPNIALAGEANAALRPIGGPNSVVALDGDEHLRARRLLLPPFHGDRMRAYERDIEELADEMIGGWAEGEVVDLLAAARSLTFEVILRTVFGIRDRARAADATVRIQKLSRAAVPVMYVPALQRDLGPLSPWRRFVKRREHADELIYDELRDRRRAGTRGREDVLSLLLSARHDDGSPLSDQELRDELMTLLMAGHENSSAAIAWTMDALLRTPDALARLRDELDSDYLGAVIREGLRYRPPIPMFGRVAGQPLELGPFTVPAGVGVLFDTWTMHHRDDLFPEPERFRPARFLDGEPPHYAYLPFGGGVRRCLGAAFAEQELRIVIQRLVSRCELELERARPEGFRFRGVTLLPARGVRVRASLSR